MRCFIGTFLPSKVQTLIHDRRPSLQQVRWTRPERYHITLRFYADLSAEKLPVAIDEAKRISSAFPLDGVATQMDGFPSRNRARVVIVRVDTHGLLEAVVDDAGFQPHVTIGYARQRAVKVPALEMGIEFRLDGVCLVESIQGRYRVVSQHNP